MSQRAILVLEEDARFGEQVVGCDECDVCPIVGIRHRKLPASENVDLCAECFGALPLADQVAYESVRPPQQGGGASHNDIFKSCSEETRQQDAFERVLRDIVAATVEDVTLEHHLHTAARGTAGVRWRYRWPPRIVDTSEGRRRLVSSLRRRR